MRILIVSAFFPPNVIGGAELSAANLARWLAGQGHEIGILTTAPTKQDCLDGEQVDDFRIWRVAMPRPYPVFQAMERGGWQKPVWHLQDHFDPRNKAIMGEVLDAFRPDLVNIHIIQGIGYNALTAIGQRNIPAVFTLHDLGLACIKLAMFVNGRECDGQCSMCARSSAIKTRYVGSIARHGFISPSKANLARISTLLSLGDYPRIQILNPNSYPAPTVAHEKSEAMRLLYVGRLEEAKGIYVLIEALEPLAADYDFSLTLVGTGPRADDLAKQYGHHDWIKFTGQIPVQDVANWMANSDLLLVPSIWLENSPGVVIQALGVSLPVMGSDKGGIPELVTNGVNGVLVPPGSVQDWRAAIKSLLDDRSQLERYRQNASQMTSEFDQDFLGAKIVKFFEQVQNLPQP